MIFEYMGIVIGAAFVGLSVIFTFKLWFYLFKIHGIDLLKKIRGSWLWQKIQKLNL
jgi:hypothetical protein